MPSSYFTFLNFEKNIIINIFITIQYLLKTLLFDPPLIFAFLVLLVHIPLIVLHMLDLSVSFIALDGTFNLNYFAGEF